MPPAHFFGFLLLGVTQPSMTAGSQSSVFLYPPSQCKIWFLSHASDIITVPPSPIQSLLRSPLLPSPTAHTPGGRGSQTAQTSPGLAVMPRNLEISCWSTYGKWITYFFLHVFPFIHTERSPVFPVSAEAVFAVFKTFSKEPLDSISHQGSCPWMFYGIMTSNRLYLYSFHQK